MATTASTLNACAVVPQAKEAMQSASRATGMSWAASFKASALKKGSHKAARMQRRVVTPVAVSDSGDFDVCLDPDVSSVSDRKLIHVAHFVRADHIL